MYNTCKIVIFETTFYSVIMFSMSTRRRYGKKQTMSTAEARHMAFVDNYFICGMNATEAYRRTYPKCKKDESAWASASQLLREPKVRAAIDERMRELQMTADEAVSRLSDMARGDIRDLLDEEGNLDWEKARQLGVTKLIKKLKVTTTVSGNEESERETTIQDVELHDPQAAIDKILKVHGRYRNIVELDSKVIKVVIGNDDDDDADEE